MIFLNEDDPIFRKDDRTIVDVITMAQAVREVNAPDRQNEGCLFEAEPILGPYVKQEMLAMIGELALNGVSPAVCTGLACQMYKLLDITGMALRDGYRNLLADLVPNADPTDSAPAPPPADNQEPDKH